MTTQSLHEALGRLRTELQGSPQLDDESRQLLAEIAAEIGRASGGSNHRPEQAPLPSQFFGYLYRESDCSP